jgi:hypothetical protein
MEFKFPTFLNFYVQIPKSIFNAHFAHRLEEEKEREVEEFKRAHAAARSDMIIK